MIGLDIWLLFFGYAVPMVISPGPGNTVLAAAGARLGLRGALPFWLGFEVANVLLCIVYGLGVGFGMAEALRGHPGIVQALKWAGAAYMLYLAWGFFRAAAAPAREVDGQAPLGLADGLLAVALNPKIHSMILVMVTQFLDPTRPLAGQVGQLTAAFLLVGITCHFPWICGGEVILGRYRSARALRVQGWIFGACMLVVAAAVALS